ncbi:hypothetical protein BCR41DRAFT_388849 [Lobosporangium transversale]|uniref:F-box domain-containing protein n=1 Tax=Lobosporangium transversale TaxID=64571 RepID=A0A1Y2GDL0_9FUNG|nr:hypothetical protein BCR41DRAFT_388849 [Lobosporangium transversale]ORZ07797.1 hypothetical protein BCR41DRAFT_388849 [Lobosporangium transversale]|eukprot:XP_021878163.1 hypothetical protein BCR41DRAFT_388849 [Lobosporangium transversale]
MTGDIKLNPLEIPEIISLVGDFLGQDDIINWRALQNNKEHIEELHFFIRLSEDYRSLKDCSRLKRVSYQIPTHSSISNDLLELIKTHRTTITHFSVMYEYSGLGEIWEVLLECTNLRILEINSSNIIEEEVDLFFRVCKKLRRLEIHTVTVSHLPANFLSDDTDTFVFPIVKLIVDNIQILNPPYPHTSSYCLGMWTRRCPGLASLLFYPPQGVPEAIEIKQIGIDFYRAAFFHRPCTLTNISELHLYRVDIKDEDMARLKGSRATVKEITCGAEWASTGLIHLAIDLEADVNQETTEGMEMQRVVFRQIGRLTRLRILELTDWFSQSEKIKTLDLRLRAGLDELVDLKSLLNLFFLRDKHQQMQLEDATWIVSNWPSIKDLYGVVSSDPDTCSLVTKLLQSHNVTIQRH